MPLRQFRADSARANDAQHGQSDSASSTLAGSPDDASALRPHAASPRPGRRYPANPRRRSRTRRPRFRWPRSAPLAPRPPLRAPARQPQAPETGQDRALRTLRGRRPWRDRAARAGPVNAVRPGQAMRDRHAHVRGAELRDHRSVAKFDQAVHDRLRMHQHVDLIRTAARTNDAPRSVRDPCSSWSRNRS